MVAAHELGPLEMQVLGMLHPHDPRPVSAVRERLQAGRLHRPDRRRPGELGSPGGHLTGARGAAATARRRGVQPGLRARHAVDHGPADRRLAHRRVRALSQPDGPDFAIASSLSFPTETQGPLGNFQIIHGDGSVTTIPGSFIPAY